jgi:hypothetical protein
LRRTHGKNKLKIKARAIWYGKKVVYGRSLFFMQVAHGSAGVAIYAPMLYTAPCVMFLMRADPLRRQVGGSWALEIESFLGPVKRHRADRRVPFWAQKTQAAVVKTGIGRKRVRGMPGVLE